MIAFSFPPNLPSSGLTGGPAPNSWLDARIKPGQGFCRGWASLFALVPFLAFAEPATYAPDPALTLTLGGETGVKYQDNLYRSPDNRTGDFIGLITPGFELNGEMQPYIFRLRGGIERGEYADESRNNYTDTDLRWNLARHRFNDDLYYLEGRFRHDHVEIGAFADDPTAQAAEPTTYRYLENALGWERDTTHWIGKLEGRSFLYNFDNGSRLGGPPLINDDRDYAQHQLTARTGYKFWPQTALFTQATLNARRYEEQIDTTLTQSHDSSGEELLAGLRWNTPDDSLRAEAALGILHQDFEASTLEDVTAPALHASLHYQPSSELRLNADLSREVREAILADTSSYIRTRAQLRGTYQLDPAWHAKGSLRYSHNDFQISPSGTRPSRIDTVWDGLLALDYLFHETYYLGGEYRHISRDSDEPTAVYDANIFLLKLGAGY